MSGSGYEASPAHIAREAQAFSDLAKKATSSSESFTSEVERYSSWYGYGDDYADAQGPEYEATLRQIEDTAALIADSLAAVYEAAAGLSDRVRRPQDEAIDAIGSHDRGETGSKR
ncbi:hypothetical protein OG233_30065 [Streptomyces sp. NBC_01218]|uniref:hypothetical protein n=1 Tax=unclassified Streptomyces TaxID=2593676 RepID=UPI0023B9F10D|nr:MULTISPECIES: hypothetical protein [unclassified Streptomyces]WEH43418.1 hypothetical protein PZB77_30160 [Streptomyces sp. AM 2-1-1]WSQ55054.1 hypothetical protein OG233_30065 [Streptomyces sp. NBC_01218]